MEGKKYFRQTAVKITIKELLQGKYVEEESGSADYILLESKEKIFRLNLLATALDINKQGSISNLWVDDGTGKIILRIFEENTNFDKLKIGETILVIGKLRKYNQEKYISPEIIKGVNPLWLKLRSLELRSSYGLKEKRESFEETIVVEKEGQEKEEGNQTLPTQKLLQLIKELDQGEGALIEEVIEKSLLQEVEKILEKMLKEGEIFLNMPGRVKVL